MKKLSLIAVILLAGCAAAQKGDADPRITRLQEESRTIAATEKQCIDGAKKPSPDQTAGTASGAAADLEIQKENHERDREVLECRAEAERKNAEIYARERDEYALQAQQDRDRARLMMILTTSQPR